MQQNIVHISIVSSLAAADPLDPIFDYLFTSMCVNDPYFACNVGFKFFQSCRLVGINNDLSAKEKCPETLNRMKVATNCQDRFLR